MNRNPYGSSPLGRIQIKELDTDKIKKAGWLEDGILVIQLDDERLGWADRECIRQIGNKLYGKTKKEVQND